MVSHCLAKSVIQPQNANSRFLISSGTRIIKVDQVSEGLNDEDDADGAIEFRPCGDGDYRAEIDADDRLQVVVTYIFEGTNEKKRCRVLFSCDEVNEEGCRSEFERLIKVNRKHLERVESKSFIHIDRSARLTHLQSWILDEKNVSSSFVPIVIAEDYGSLWSPLKWNREFGPIISKGKFLHDPRPQNDRFMPPREFIDARTEIAKYIRGNDDQSGLIESSPLGDWLSNDDKFKALVEKYIDSYSLWLDKEPKIACWVDTLAVCSLESSGHTLRSVPDAIILNPLHPIRLAWHCIAQKVLVDEALGDYPCPAASILDPSCIPDLLRISLQAPDGYNEVDYVSIECSSDYWSVLWNGSRLADIGERSLQAPFDDLFGLTVGGISRGFSPAQVSRALEDVTDLLSAKSIVSLTISSAGGATEACNEGLTSWCIKNFSEISQGTEMRTIGLRRIEIYDIREDGKPDQATIANLSEDTENRVHWYEKQPLDVAPDLGIIAQLDSAEPEIKSLETRSPMSIGGLIRHRVRRQLKSSFLCESRQGLATTASGDSFIDKVSNIILKIEHLNDQSLGLHFSPNVHAVSRMLDQNRAGFVAVSSAAIDPACFLGGWIKNTYLWDYDLPSYSSRAGDTNGYYLLAQVKESDRDALQRALKPLPQCEQLGEPIVGEILLEVARRGIPTVRGLSGDDTGATGDLGMFIAVRLLQDQFRIRDNKNSLLPIISDSEEGTALTIIVPIDPFRSYLSDLARSVGKGQADKILSRPDLLVIGVVFSSGRVNIQLTPIEVKCRQTSTLNSRDSSEALNQAKALSELFLLLEERGKQSKMWRLTYQHLLLSIIGFGLRVYSQHQKSGKEAARWARFHEEIAAEILRPQANLSIDSIGRLIVVDQSDSSRPLDHDNDGFFETIVISGKDAGKIVIDNKVEDFYDVVRDKLGDWGLLPNCQLEPCSAADSGIPPQVDTATQEDSESVDLSCKNSPEEESEFDSGEGVCISVGQSTDGFESRNLSLNISDTRLNQLNIGVVGDLGTGKTQFLKSIIYQIVKSSKENRGIKPRFLIFDYKRDYSSDEFVEATGAKVIKPHRLPLNLFDTSGLSNSVAPWLDRFRFFADILDKIYSGIGPVQRDKLKTAVRNAYELASAQDRQPTLYDVHAEYRELLGSKSDSPMSIIDDLVDMEVFARDVKPSDSIEQFLDGVVVISLDQLGQDDRSKNMLVAVMLNMFYENMLSTPKRPFLGTEPQLRAIDSFLLVDEADNIMRYDFDILRKLLLQGREFGTGVILASQYLKHFKTGATDYREPLLTWFIHKVPNVTASELGVLGFTSEVSELAEQVKTLPNHHCLYKSFDVTGAVIRGLPFFEIKKSSKKSAPS